MRFAYSGAASESARITDSSTSIVIATRLRSSRRRASAQGAAPTVGPATGSVASAA